MRDGKPRVFQSRAHLAAWHRDLEDTPRALRVLCPRHQGDVSLTLDTLAREPNGGTVFIHTPPGLLVLDWIDGARMEHGPDALDGPYPVRVAEDAGVLVGVVPSPAPSAWDEVEPDAWPVPDAQDRFDDRRVARLLRCHDFAAPVGVSEQDHRTQTLLDLGAHRWFRGALVPNVAGLVAFGDRPEKHLPGCAVALRRSDAQDQVLTGSLPWLAERVSGERAWWGAVPRDVARLLVVLALAERAWAGSDAATPITLSREGGRVRLAIPTAPANARERLDRAPGNPHLRKILIRLGELPRIAGDDLPDNDAVLRWINARHPGARCRYARAGTWLEIQVEPELRRAAVVGLWCPSVAALPEPAPVDPSGIFAPSQSRSPLAAPLEAPAPPSASPPTPPVATAPTVAPVSAPPRPPRRPGPSPAFHPRPIAAPAPSAAPSPAPPPPEPAPAPEPPALPPVPPPTGPMTLDERKTQIRAVFLKTDRPLSTREIAEILGVHRDTPLAALKALAAEGWLEQTDPNPRSPVQRYRRTGP